VCYNKLSTGSSVKRENKVSRYWDVSEQFSVVGMSQKAKPPWGCLPEVGQTMLVHSSTSRVVVQWDFSL
jgi:hypothetical protein